MKTRVDLIVEPLRTVQNGWVQAELRNAVSVGLKLDGDVWLAGPYQIGYGSVRFSWLSACQSWGNESLSRGIADVWGYGLVNIGRV